MEALARLSKCIGQVLYGRNFIACGLKRIETAGCYVNWLISLGD